MSRNFVLDYKYVKPLGGSPAVSSSKLPKNGGSYSGKTPSQAARKAFNKIARLGQGNRKSVSYQVGIRETKDCKVRLYKGTRTKLSSPIMMERGGNKFLIEHDYTFKYIGMADQ